MERFQMRFESLAQGGDAIGRDESGRAVFAPRAAPDDLAEVEIFEARKKFARARLLRVLEPSADRVSPPCPYFDTGSLSASCGGCAWQHLSYASQLGAKRSLVRDALRRIGGVEAADSLVHDCIPSSLPFTYRNKADFVVSPAGDIGFCAPSSHQVVNVARCAIAQPRIDATLAAVRSLLGGGMAPPYDAETGHGVLRRIVVRVSTASEVLVVLETSDGLWAGEAEFVRSLCAREPAIVGVLRRARPRHGARPGKRDAGSALSCLSGRDWLEEEVNGLRFRVRADGFFQINSVMTPVLLDTALGMTGARPGATALDLFCGVGLFSLGMARLGAAVTGIEWDAAAVREARGNAALNGLEAQFHVGDSVATLRRLRRQGLAGTDTVLLDPPRAGAAELVAEIAALGPSRVVYVSCDPATLARDVKLFGVFGYRPTEAVPIDLFPQTSHVETVLALAR